MPHQRGNTRGSGQVWRRASYDLLNSWQKSCLRQEAAKMAAVQHLSIGSASCLMLLTLLRHLAGSKTCTTRGGFTLTYRRTTLLANNVTGGQSFREGSPGLMQQGFVISRLDGVAHDFDVKIAFVPRLKQGSHDCTQRSFSIT